MPRDAVSRTAHVERNGGHKWVKADRHEATLPRTYSMQPCYATYELTQCLTMTCKGCTASASRQDYVSKLLRVFPPLDTNNLEHEDGRNQFVNPVITTQQLSSFEEVINPVINIF